MSNHLRNGVIAAVGCAVLWGVLPIYWQLLRPIDSTVIIFYRILLVGVVSFLLALKAYGIKGIASHMKDKKLMVKTFLAGLLITINWSMYIWAVNANFVIETCIGYYIEPLVVCIFGIIFFKERLTSYKLVAFIFACIGVLVILIYYFRVPFIALTIALTFAIYAAVKKTYSIPAVLSLLYETMFLVPIAFVVVVYMEIRGIGAIGVGEPYQYGLLMFSGLFTVIPLGLFAMSAKRISLIALGIIEYISPSISLIIGIFLFKEPFDTIQFVAFAIIWVGLIFFTYGGLRENRLAQREN